MFSSPREHTRTHATDVGDERTNHRKKTDRARPPKCIRTEQRAVPCLLLKPRSLLDCRKFRQRYTRLRTRPNRTYPAPCRVSTRTLIAPNQRGAINANNDHLKEHKMRNRHILWRGGKTILHRKGHMNLRQTTPLPEPQQLPTKNHF